MSDLHRIEDGITTALDRIDATNLAHTLTNLNEVIDRWPDFEQSRIKGTQRHIRTVDFGATREETGEAGLGSMPSLIHLDVLDAMADVLMTAHGLHDHVAQTVGHPTLAYPSSAYADPRPYLTYIVKLLPEACETDAEMLEAATDKTDEMRSTILIKLGEVYDGQVLDAICPFCIGRTFRTPSGQKTMRVRLVPSRIHEGTTEMVVVCENPDGCHALASECDMWVKGKPAWPWSQWEWLAERLLPAGRQTG